MCGGPRYTLVLTRAANDRKAAGAIKHTITQSIRLSSDEAI